jgi:NTP pyrophosphatase (non-canonical NTP hydrolase)
MMLEKNISKGAMDTDLLDLYADLMYEITELWTAIRKEGNDRVAEEAGDCIAYLSRMVEVIKYGSEV